jgi:CHAT domain-containing protein
MQPLRALLGEGAANADSRPTSTTRWILLSPDGALNLVPFGALVDQEGRYLIKRASFTYLTSGRDLLRLAERSPDPQQGALILANPDFGDVRDERPERAGAPAIATRSADMSALLFKPLRETEAEGEEVSRSLGGATLLTHAGATEEAIKAAKGPRLLHVASHGFFLPDRRGDAEREDDARRVENPLLRAGLALAGANRRRSATDAEDAVLTALEISGLDLRGTRLVVLSACETGVGATAEDETGVGRGEGVYGLRRALVMAGAETQVMSLWSVADEATKTLMSAYYRGLAAGGGRSESMRQAQLAMLATEGSSHPFYWASFIVSGNGVSAPAVRAPATPSTPPPPEAPRPQGDGDLGPLQHLPLREAKDMLVEQFERRYLATKLRDHGGNISRTADAIGLSRQQLHRLIERYGLRGAER